MVAIGNRIVAVEGAEGTDAMLARVAALRAEAGLTPPARQCWSRRQNPARNCGSICRPSAR
ncbi:MAG: UDP-2,3-diacylglucosamine diphosphatase LpxI [Phyllobacteriaceae bacterium]|nr:UDP-2,3-diacylglucosamine diphosphatase LpxI [Phyllobacteriaceae bacterium]